MAGTTDKNTFFGGTTPSTLSKSGVDRESMYLLLNRVTKLIGNLEQSTKVPSAKSGVTEPKLEGIKVLQELFARIDEQVNENAGALKPARQ